MSKFYEIFSKKTETIEESEKEKQNYKKETVIVDHREKNSLVPSELSRLGLNVIFENLKVGDFIVKDTIIERKTVSDFISSMINKRLISQLNDLQQFENRLLMIEGIDEKELYNNDSGVNPNSIRGFILSISLNYKVPIIFTKDSSDTAMFISLIANRKSAELGINAKKQPRDYKEQLQYILEGFPGIGPKTAKKLLSEFKTLKGVMNTPQEELTKIIGKKAEIFKILDLNY